MEREINIGVLGIGRIGLFHCEQILATPGLRLVAASSRSEELIQSAKEKYRIQTYDTHERLLNDPEVHWVVISTTSDQHKEWSLKALEREKELIIEKPIALSLSETVEIVETARKKKLRITVHHNRRWDVDFVLVRRILEEGILGKVYRIESRYTDFSIEWAGWGAQGLDNPWRLKKKYGGGLISDWGPHLFDQALVLANAEVQSIFGKTYQEIWSKEVDDHFWAETLFENGLSVRVEASNNFRIPLPRWNIIGTKGCLQIPGGTITDWKFATIAKEYGAFVEERRIDLPRAEQPVGFYREFYTAVVKKDSLPIQPTEIVKVMSCIDAVKESSRTGRAVQPG